MQDEENRAKVKAAAINLRHTLHYNNIGSAYGYPFGFDIPPQYYLIIYSDDPIHAPIEFEGYKVVIRGIPQAL